MILSDRKTRLERMWSGRIQGRKSGGGNTYAIHAEIVPDAILPAFGLAVGGLVGVSLEPVVDVT